MDRHKASWIMEFVLRQPIDDWLAKQILLRLPMPPVLDPHLRKTFLLRRLSSVISAERPLCHRTLDTLELLEEQDRSLPTPGTLHALKAAYCAVATELTMAPLRMSLSSEDAEAQFLEAVEQIWNRRVADLERSDARSLAGEELMKLKREVEDAVAGARGRRGLLRRDTRRQAKAALREYVRVALEDMGHPLLELIAEEVAGEASAGRGIGYERDARARDTSGLSDEPPASAGGKGGDERPSGAAVSIEPSVMFSASASGLRRDEKIAGSMVDAESSDPVSELGVFSKTTFGDLCHLRLAIGTGRDPQAPDNEKYKGIGRAGQEDLSLPFCEGSKGKVEHGSMSVCLPEATTVSLPETNTKTVDIMKASANQKDPGEATIEAVCRQRRVKLIQEPSAIYVVRPSIINDNQLNDTDNTEVVLSKTSEGQPSQNSSENNHIQADRYVGKPSTEKCAQATTSVAAAIDEVRGGEHSKRFGLMERNPTAHTCQWDDVSSESLSEKSADSSKRPHLPTPRTQTISPLQLYDEKKFVRRRKIKRWTSQEVDALREGVQKHGAGNWKFILQCYRETFEDRTEVDLKDKWRNMKRSGSTSLTKY